MSIQPGFGALGKSPVSTVAWQTLFLFAFDGLTNVVDYGFHVYLGRALAPGEFAVVQTVNAVMLIALTTCGVLQPVVAKYVAEARLLDGRDQDGRAVFQLYFAQGTLAGLALLGVVWLARQPIAIWLNVPVPVLAVGAPILVLALIRPVVFGMLQGRQQFVAYGFTRAAFAVGRLAVAIILVSFWQGGVLGGVAAVPLGAVISLVLGLLWLRRAVWRRAPAVSRRVVWEGWQLSVGALLAYAAYMLILSSDLIWVNRAFPPVVAGNYAAAVVFRRILSVLPGVVLVILFPRIVETVARGRLPDRILAQASLVILLPTLLLTGAYFLWGEQLVRLVFGGDYSEVAPLLGWMGVAMVGYGFAGMWLNLFLATRPWPYVIFLVVVAITQASLLARGYGSLLAVTALFAYGGWLLAVGGLLIYGFWLRPRLGRSE